MSDFTFPTYWPGVVFFVAAFTMGIGAIVVSRRIGARAKQIMSALFGAAIVAVLVYAVVLPFRVSIGENGVAIRALLSRNITPDEISKVEMLTNLQDSPYALKARTFGVSLHGFSFGYFVSARSKKTFALIDGNNPVCVLSTADAVYLISPPSDFAEFSSAEGRLAQSVDQHR